MTTNVVQDISGISVNNVSGAVKASVGGQNFSGPLWYGSYPKDTIDTTTFSGFPGASVSNKWIGAVQATNGKIYFIPYDATFVLILDVLKGTIDTTSIAGITGSAKFAGGVLAKNGKIYCVPFSANYVGIIDTLNDTFDSTTITGITGTGNWIGGTLAHNEKIYCAPANANEVLIINTLTDTAEDTSITGITGINKFAGNCLARNGFIYHAPSDAAYVLIIDPFTDMADTTSILVSSTAAKWQGCCYSMVNDKIYCGPRGGDQNVLIIDPGTNTGDETTITGLVGSWMYPNFSPNGKIYCSPLTSSSILVIDPATNTTDTSITVPVVAGNKTSGTITDVVTGSIVSIPFTSQYIGIVKTGIPQYNIEFVTSNCRNKL